MSGASFPIHSYWSKGVLVKTAYSSVMAGLAWWQRANPKYAGQILRIQRLALILDFACWVNDLHDIGKECQRVYNLSKGEEEKKWYHSPIKVTLVFAVGVFVIPFILTPFAVSQINRYAKPVLDVTALFRDMSGTSEPIDFKAGWSVPKIQRASQWILLNRIVANVVLTAISPKRVFYGASFLLQAFTLKNISQLYWLRIEKPINELLVSVIDGKREVATLKGNVIFEFFIPPLKPANIPGSKCRSMVNHLQEGVKSIYDYMMRCLPSKQFKSNGAGNRFKGYDLWIPTPKLEPCPCGGQIFLDKVTGVGAHSSAGTVSIQITRV